MAAEAKPYKEGKTWSMRRRILGQELFVSGEKTSAAAKKEMDKLVHPLKTRGAPKGLGPQRTTVAQAAQDYGMARLRFMKGAVQEANRINKYLRALGLDTLKVTKWADAVAAGKVQDVVPATDGEGKGPLFLVELEPALPQRDIPKGLGKHRGKLACATAKSDTQRALIARMPMADVRRHHMQDLVDALRADARSASTTHLERAFVRTLFYYANEVWNWNEPSENPATGLRMPELRNERDRVMSMEEQQRLDEAIQDCRNKLVGPTLALLRATAMRASEPLEHARWRDVDWQRKVLTLTDGKTGKRDVPLLPEALEALKELQALGPCEPDDKLVCVSYEALKAAWQRACTRAGIDDLRVHDLRHTAATRLALESGNVFLVKALTGHKDDKMVQRYVNVKADDVVKFGEAQAAKQKQAEQTSAAAAVDGPLPANVVQLDFGQRRKA
ncbi:tyrosine-type recombinase/integrase [Roseateles violae]|uniref:Site-specific integrase n=1 Tax=Roseateles violae TaxID=3058042 RepID=A0ABT8DR16_9BURK|nr:site-specific integrase [Pelomonas sp. PFR6]MDN3918737.1 site-specific integrase [Pelomonas sp. PFR6]